MIVAALALSLVVPALEQPQQGQSGKSAPKPDRAEQMQRELARLVDLPSPRGRRLQAEKLTRQNLGSVDDWLAACRAFGAFDRFEPGQNRREVTLPVLGRPQKSEIFLYVPERYDSQKPAPLLLWGHGAGGTGARQYRPWQQLADRLGMLVLAPSSAAAQPGWGFTANERASQLAALRWARRHCNVDENAVFLGGASRGGHMTWDLALRHPDLWAGLVPCIGGPRMQLGEQNNMRYLANVAHLPIRCLQGSKDDPMLLVNLRVAFDHLKKKRNASDAVFREFPELGHSYELAGVDWNEFFARRRAQTPERVIRTAAVKTEGRSAWCRITAFERNVRVKVAPRVSSAQWERLDERGRRKLLLDRLGRYTAELEVHDRGKGRFTAKSKGVKSFELLLTPDMMGRDGRVEVRCNRRPVRVDAEPRVEVLLAEFAERLDRTFLPVAVVTITPP
ncbi:MAG: hypothetical protein NXI31_12280 [bacterium]|nr:hypothetical protein [bacterium]